ncbi:Ca-activated chloride channel family protein [Thiothrix caldifontis]|uniref:Ca-activated chloride channel family protein n=1 Tax=Thiothrix caldifontis TaxID=525918 RepID=A0A1H3Y863_9GAMM|nr:VWA domain-containing protein [Thiothrix caldifontis]SEA07877.1 Ca-activated chloride channel family protein [Thiothrix caldifontis]
MVLNDLHFLHPEWLWLLGVIPFVWGIKWFHARQQGGWERLVDKQLMPFVLSGSAGSLGWGTLVWLSLVLLVGILAMAGPAWDKREVPVFRNQQALVVAMDFSASMYAEDEKPNRITLARFKLLDILNSRNDAQNGLVVFAGDAFTVTPLTDDIDTIEEQVKNLSPEIMPAPGSLLTPAIQRSVELLQQSGMKQGNILLITDGVSDTQAALSAAEEVRGLGYRVSVLSLGTAEGAPIARAKGGFLLDSFGKTVIAKVNLDDLERIADAGGGIFVKAALGDADVSALSQRWQTIDKGMLTQAKGLQTDTWVNEGYWLVLLLLPVVALAFRRGWLGVVVVCVLLPQQQPVYAFSWDELWQTPDQQAQAALENGELERAAGLFQNPDWKGAAAYKNKDYATAAQLYATQNSLDAQYNYGNAQAKAGKFQEAIAAYQQVLAANPNHADAQHNLKILEDALKQQQQGQSDPQQQPEQNQQQNQQQSGADAQQQQGQQGQQGQEQQQQSAAEEQQPQADAAKAAEEQAKQQEQQQDAPEQADKAKQDEAESKEDPQQREQEQATEQWLRRIPDDPSGLWRRKFQYQYQQRGAQTRGDEW